MPKPRKLAELARAFQREGGPGVADYDRYWDARQEIGEVPYTTRDTQIVREVGWEVRQGGALLDLGIGPAHYFRTLMKDYEMFGVEISTKMIASYPFDTSRVRQCDLNEEFPHFDFQFDGVIASMIFHHVDHPERLMEWVFGIMQPRGLLVVAAPNLWHIKNRLRVLRGSSPRWSPAHRHFLTPAELSRKIEAAGFHRFKVLPGRPSQNGGLAWLWPSLGAGQLILLFRKEGEH